MRIIVFIISFIFTSIGFPQNFWEKTTSPYPIDKWTTYTHLAIDSSNYIYAIGSSIMASPPFVRSEDNGNSWSLLAPNGLADNSYIGSILVNSNGYLLAATSQNGTIISTDHGDSWNSLIQDASVIPNCLATNNSGILFAGTYDSGVYRSLRNGIWERVLGPSFGRVSCLAINSGGYIFAGTWSGVYRSTDDGDNWVQVNNGLVNPDVRTLIIKTNGDIIIGDDNGTVSLSTNNGDSWTQIGTLGSQIMSMAVNSQGNIFVGTWAWGVYCTKDNGNNWNQINSGIYPYVYALAINSDGIIFAGGADGIYRGNSILGIGDKELSANNFRLQQNYPNPFNPSTTINYSIAKAGNVMITVYNIPGSRMATIVNEYKPAGNYSVNFDGSKLVSGIYFYKIEAGPFSQVKKMMLVK